MEPETVEEFAQDLRRHDAIEAIVAVWQGYDAEFCIGQKERDDSQAEMYASLAALGVTREEADAE